MTQPLPFIDLAAQQARLGDRLRLAIDTVLREGAYIMGRQVADFERQLAEFCGARHVISCANGTDALMLPLMAWGIGPGDAVFVPSFTFIASAEAPALLGATPVFVDVQPETFDIDPASLHGAVAHARSLGLRPKAVLPVDLFGLPSDYDTLLPLAEDLGLLVLADAAQGFGGAINGRRTGTFGQATATSFFPAKPLGCYGDGGAVLTDDDQLAARLRSLRFHGKGQDKYDNVAIGLNSRLDTLQAAILSEKLAIFADELAARDRIAARYTTAFQDRCPGLIIPPTVLAGYQSAWAQYTLRVAQRDQMMAACKEQGVPTMVYYPIPLHRQSGYAHYPQAPLGCPVSEQLAAEVVSLPMHPYLGEQDQSRIIDVVCSAVEKTA